MAYWDDEILGSLGKIQAVLEAHSERLERIERQLFGNGETSLSTRLALIEQRLSFATEQQEQKFKELVAQSLVELPRQQRESSVAQRWGTAAAWVGAIIILIFQIVNLFLR